MRIPLDWLKEYVDLGNLSAKEIGDAFTQIGLMTDKPFDGKVFDLEHRFDRSDWLSILGCARDLAAYLDVDLKLPQVYTQEGKKPSNDQLVDIRVECPDTVNRFNTRVFRNVKVKPSPDWLKSRLEEYGIPSINNVVDITNYVMVEAGQPMHAQDLAKFRKQEIVIRKAGEGEKIVTLLGEGVEMVPEAFVLTQDGVPTVLGGIVGGKETGVDESTIDIILDAGNYNQNVIRKVSRKLKIQNETVSRYDKFLHPDLTQYAIERATYLLLELAGGEYYQNVDWKPAEFKSIEMNLRMSRVHKLAGFEIPNDMITNILTKLGYQIVSRSAESLKVVVPYFRTDVEVEDDIVSDILRINGYSKIPTSQIQSAPPKEITPDLYKFEDTLRDVMVQLGAHEHITDPLISRDGNLLESPVLLENSQNSQKNAMRIAIVQTLNEIVPNYLKNQINSGILFEIGKTYTQDGNRADFQTYRETRVLECLLFNKDCTPKELHKKTSSLLTALLENIGLRIYLYKKVGSLPEAEIVVDKKTVGSVRYNGFTLLTEKMLGVQKNVDRVISNVQAPNTLETSFTVAKDFPVGTLMDTIKSSSIDVVRVDFLEEYVGLEIEDNKRSVLIKMHFKPDVTQINALKVVEKTVENLKKTTDITIRA